MFKCEKCNKEYQFEKSYNKHVKNCTHGDLKTYICKICGKEFNKKGALGGHMVSAHGNMNKKENHKCPICDKILYTNKGAFENHIKLHDEEFNKNRGQKSSNTRQIFLNSEKGKEYKEKMRQRMLINNPMYNQETIDKMVKSRKEYFKNMTDEEYSKLVVNFINAPKKGNAVNHSGKCTPTKPEKINN